MTRIPNRLRLTIGGLAAVALAATACSSASGSDPSGTQGNSQTGDSSSAKNQAAYDLLPERVKKAGTVRFVDVTNPPFWIVSGNDVSGAGVELSKALAAVLGVKADIQVVGSSDAGRTGLLADRFDVLVGPATLTADRHKQFDGVTYLVAGSSVLLKKTNTTVNADLDLCGLKIAVVTSKGGADATKIEKQNAVCASSGKKSIGTLAVGDPNSLALAVLSGQADAALTTSTVAADVERTNATLRHYNPTGEILGHKLRGGYLCLPDISNALYTALKVLYDNGQYKAILEKWNLGDSVTQAPALNELATNG